MVRIAMSSGFVFYVKNASWFSVQTECDAMGKLCLIICTGCSLNIVFYSRILKYSGLLPFSVFPRCQCM